MLHSRITGGRHRSVTGCHRGVARRVRNSVVAVPLGPGAAAPDRIERHALRYRRARRMMRRGM